MKKMHVMGIVVALCLFTYGCSTMQSIGNNVNMFTVEDDIALGNQTFLQIRSDTDNEYPLLDTVKYAAAYTQIRALFNNLLNVGLTYRDVFNWRLYIIDKDDVLNAFAVPGGTVFVYTGLINYLENDQQLAGVLAHEISHIDLRHSTKQLTKAYGVDFLTQLVTSYTGSAVLQTAASVTNSLAQLSFSRADEYEADATAVAILAAAQYDPYQTAGFFQKMINDNSSGATIEWLSSHPSDQNRISAIQKRCQDMGKTPYTTAQLASSVSQLQLLKNRIK